MEKRTILEIGKLANKIKELWNASKEEEAYEVLNELNSKLSDLDGKVLEMEDILKVN